MEILLTIIYVVVCLFLILVVLLQSGKAGDLASAFGGQSSQTAFGSRGTANLLSRATSFSAVGFLILALALAIVSARKSGSVLEKIAPPPRPETPATAPAEPVSPEAQPTAATGPVAPEAQPTAATGPVAPEGTAPVTGEAATTGETPAPAQPVPAEGQAAPPPEAAAPAAGTEAPAAPPAGETPPATPATP